MITGLTRRGRYVSSEWASPSRVSRGERVEKDAGSSLIGTECGCDRASSVVTVDDLIENPQLHSCPKHRCHAHARLSSWISRSASGGTPGASPGSTSGAPVVWRPRHGPGGGHCSGCAWGDARIVRSCSIRALRWSLPISDADADHSQEHVKEHGEKDRQYDGNQNHCQASPATAERADVDVSQTHDVLSSAVCADVGTAVPT